MKLTWGILLSSLYCSAAASKAGHVFVFDPTVQATPQQPQVVSPETARLILAQRLGLSQYHSLNDANDEVIQQISAFGGRPRKFFSHPNDLERTDAQVLVWVEGVDNIDAVIRDSAAYTADFSISSPPPASANDRLVQDMIIQAQSLPRRSDPFGWTYKAETETETALKSIKNIETYNQYFNVLIAHQSDDLDMTGLSKALDDLLRKSKGAAEGGWAVTVVLMPSSSPHTKREAQPWGSYDLPTSLEARRENTEALLSPSSSQPSDMPQTPNVSDLEDFPSVQQASDDSPVLGILPKCFSTEDACSKQTHNCSSHGICVLARKGETGKDSRVRDCWSCQCKADRKHVGEDTGMESKFKTTYWGGPACQKKDVSQPFWLFAAVGVLLAFLIASGIGLLYSMGSEELPSVIGAGVSGPSRK